MYDFYLTCTKRMEGGLYNALVDGEDVAEKPDTDNKE